LVLTENLLSDTHRPIFFIPTYCPSGLHIVLDADPAIGAVKWSISRDLYINLNGNSIPMNGISPFGDILARITLDALFISIKTDFVKSAVNYSTNLNSIELIMRSGKTQFVLSQSDHLINPTILYPLFIPCLAGIMTEPRPKPYDRLKELLDARCFIGIVENVVFDVFLNCDFVTVLMNRKKMEAAIELRGRDCVQAVLLRISNGKVVVNDQFNCVVFEWNEGLEEVLRKWCGRLYWKMFEATAERVARQFGFRVEKGVGGNCVVFCENERRVEFRGRAEINEIWFGIVEEGMGKLLICWNAIPFAGYFQRFSYLFFFPIFKGMG
jgi:hypothetical protein